MALELALQEVRKAVDLRGDLRLKLALASLEEAFQGDHDKRTQGRQAGYGNAAWLQIQSSRLIAPKRLRNMKAMGPWGTETFPFSGSRPCQGGRGGWGYSLHTLFQTLLMARLLRNEARQHQKNKIN